MFLPRNANWKCGLQKEIFVLKNMLYEEDNLVARIIIRDSFLVDHSNYLVGN